MSLMSRKAVFGILLAALVGLPSGAETVTAGAFTIRDPFVMVDGGRYWLYAARYDPANFGVSVRESADLVHWSEPKSVLTLPPKTDCTAVWAPEVHRYNGAYWLFVTLTQSTNACTLAAPAPGTRPSMQMPRGTWIYKATSPRGPFAPVSDKPATPREQMALDGTLFVENGTPYLVYCHEWCQMRNGTIEFAPMELDLSGLVAAPRKILDAESAMPGAGFVTDGPFFWRSAKDKRLHMIWSNFVEGRSYCVLTRTSKSGRLAGPWSADRLLYQENGGHAMIFRDLQGQVRLALHQPNSGPERLHLFPVFEDADGLHVVPEPTNLTAEYRTDPVGLDTPAPRLSWRMGAVVGAKNVRQGAYRVLVATSAEALAEDRADLWDSGKVSSDRSLNVVYAGKPLPSSQRIHWKVKTWDAAGAESGWSFPASWVQAKTTPWTAKWIGAKELPEPAFRKTFAVRGGLKSAFLHITGLGYYVASLNGTRVGDKVLDPSPTSYDRRVLFSTYDLKSQLREGANELKVILGRGWYDVPVDGTWNFDEAPWRDRPRMIAELELAYADGTRETVVTDSSWTTCENPVIYDSLRENEVIDALGGEALRFAERSAGSPRAERARPKLGRPADVVAAPKGKLCAAAHPGSKVVRLLKPVCVKKVDAGWMVTFPENIAGWVRLRLHDTKKGAFYSIRYDERIEPDGTPAKDRKIDMYGKKVGPGNPFRGASAFQTDWYVAGGAAVETYEPQFNWNGFQYVLVTGVEELKPEDIVACEVRTAFGKIGKFESSDPTLNKLMAAADRSYRANFTAAIPTDCPHREKNGWTGDAAVASELAQYFYENTAAYEKWLRDICDAMTAEGCVPGIVPAGVWGGARDSRNNPGPVWDAALPVIAWNLWLYRGDRRILETVFPFVERMLAFEMAHADAEGLVDYGLGDWVPVDSAHKPAVRYTSSAYVYQSQVIASRMAAVLGKKAEAARYAAEAKKMREAIRRRFASPDGTRFENGRQTAMALALAMRLVDPGELAGAADATVQSIHDAGVAVDFGLIGSKHLFRALSDAGFTDLALAMLLKNSSRSFAKWMEAGSTTLWEDFGDGASRNHIMYGDFMAWAFEYLAGIRLADAHGSPAIPAPEEDDVAFRKMILAPQPVRRLDFVKASTFSPYGRIASAWERKDGKIRYTFEVPPNTTARIVLPKGPAEGRVVGSGIWTFEEEDAPCTVSIDFTRSAGRPIRPLAGVRGEKPAAGALTEMPKSALGAKAARTATGATELAAWLVRLQKEGSVPAAAAIEADPANPDCRLYSFPDGDKLPPYYVYEAFGELYRRGREGVGTESWSEASGGKLLVLAAQAEEGACRQAFLIVNPSRTASHPMKLSVKGGPRFYRYYTIDRDSRGLRHEGRIKSGDKVTIGPTTVVYCVAEP